MSESLDNDLTNDLADIPVDLLADYPQNICTADEYSTAVDCMISIVPTYTPDSPYARESYKYVWLHRLETMVRESVYLTREVISAKRSAKVVA
jgi:hypothetical protein